MKKLIFLLIVAFVMAGPASGQSQPLKISSDGRRILKADGKPFIWLGDTAWELFHRLNREEADYYLQDRASKGFNVIQAVVLAELDGLNTPNAYGERPLLDNDPTRPNEAYFKHVDYIVDKAAALGMYIGMLPTWGDKWNQRWGVGPVVFDEANARAYGEFLGRRCKNRPIIWILGGDRSPENEEHLAIVRAMAEGLASGDGGTHLMTYHPMGGNTSSLWFHNDPWLDINMFQSGHHALDIANYQATEADYARTPAKPVVDGEPRYEDHPINWNPQNGWFNDFDVRQAGYWSILSGAAGHTYGNHDIWQMWQPGRQPVSSARTPWREAVGHIGSAQVGYMKRLFESRPFETLVPDQSLVVEPGRGAELIRAARGNDYVIAYTPYGNAIRLVAAKLQGRKYTAWWFDPRTGKAQRTATPADLTFDPPGTPTRGNDWVLVLDAAGTRHPEPGQ